MRQKGWLSALAFFLVGVFWLSGVGIPLASLFSYLSFSSSKLFLLDPLVLSVFWTTLSQALFSTVISAVLGLFLGLWVGRACSLGQLARVESFLALPYGVPTCVAAIAWVAWLGNAGILSKFGLFSGWAYSLKAVVLAHVFYNIPWVALLVAQSRKAVPSNQLEAAQMMGASFLSRFFLITWPQIRWSFAGACSQVLSLCAMSFVLVLILGGGPPVQTLETTLYSRLRFGAVDVSGAAACAFWELLVTLIPWALILYFQSRQQLEAGAIFQIRSRRGNGLSRFENLALLGLAGFFLVPYLIVLKSRNLAKLLDPGIVGSVLESMWISILLALLTSLGALLFASASVYALRLLKSTPRLRTGLGVLIAIPGGVSVLVLGLGFWLAYEKWIDPFEGSLWVMVALQQTLFFPMVLRVLWGAESGIQSRQLEAAATLGAGPLFGFWWVEWPRWKGPLLSAFALVLGGALGEVGAVSLFYSEKLIPLPLMITRWMQQYRFDEAQGVAGLLLLLSLLLMGISLEISGRKSESRFFG